MRLRLLVALMVLAAPVSAAPRVVLVGVDGASWTLIDPLIAQGRLPHLAALMARGVHAELETMEPVISPVVWTTVATGRRPEAHGIHDFFGDAGDVRVATIFERLAVQGLRVGLYDYLVTWPPRALPDGFVIPGWLRRDPTTAPPDAVARSGGSGYRYSNREIRSRRGYFETSFRELEQKAAQWNALARAFELDGGAVSFYAIDALSHRFWADSFPEEFAPGDVSPPEPAYAGAIPDAYAAMDRALGEIAKGLAPDGALMLASDHGFQAHDGFQRRWVSSLEAPLARAGLVPGRDAFTLEGQFGFVTVRVHPGPFAEREALLDRLIAFFESATTEAGVPLFRVDPLDVAPRPPEARRSLLARLRQWGLRVVGRWLFSIQLDDEAHAFLVMIPENDTLESLGPDGRIRLADEVLPRREVIYGDGFTGAHLDTAVFLAAGGPLRHVPERGRLSVLDVAPLFAYLAGAGIPDDLEGRLPTEWISPEALAASPPRSLEAAGLARLPDPAMEGGEASDATLRERLRSLGYVD